LYISAWKIIDIAFSASSSTFSGAVEVAFAEDFCLPGVSGSGSCGGTDVNASCFRLQLAR